MTIVEHGGGMSAFTIGSVVGGVRLEAEIGRGGMGVVYRGFQSALNRTVAVKVVQNALADDEEFSARFRRECEIAASLEHPHVVPIYSADVDDGRLSVVMRFVDGLDLAAMVGRHGPLPLPYAVEVIAQVASALDSAHRRNLVHRDIKPANILVTTAEGRPHAYLTDFGLSRATGDSRGITESGVLMGTPEYMAPEQYEDRRLDPRADVYALGCVLFQCVTGRAPYRRDSAAALMWAHLSEPPPSPRSVSPALPPGLDTVIARALAKRPEDRYQTAGELARAFRDAVAAGTIRPWTPADTSPRTVVPNTHRITGPPPPPHRPPSIPPPRTPPQSVPHPVAPPITGTHRSRWLTVGLPVAALVLVAAVIAVLTLVPSGSVGTIAGSVPVGRKPLDVEVGAGFVWTANADDGTVSKIDPVTMTSQTIPVGGAPNQIVVEPDAVWVLDLWTSVTRIDMATGAQTSVAGPGAGIRAIEAGGGYLWLCHAENNTVSRIDMATQRLDPMPPVAVGRQPNSMIFANDILYVGNLDDRTISMLSRWDGAVLGPPLTFSSDVGGMEIEDGTIYVVFGDAAAPVDQSRFIVRPLNVASNLVGPPIDVGPASWFEVGRGAGWATYPFADELRRIDLGTGAATGDPVRGVGGDVGAMRADGEDLWVTDVRDNTVTRVTIDG